MTEIELDVLRATERQRWDDFKRVQSAADAAVRQAREAYHDALDARVAAAKLLADEAAQRERDLLLLNAGA